MNNEIWDRIVIALKDADLPHTQQAIADLCGIKQPSVHEWTTGSIPSRRHMFMIATATNVATEWLETGRGPKHLEPDDKSRLAAVISTLQSLSEDELNSVTDYVDYVRSKRASDSHLE